MLRTNKIQGILYTSTVDDINVTNINFYLNIPKLIPSVETQLKFNEATQKNFKIFHDG